MDNVSNGNEEEEAIMMDRKSCTRKDYQALNIQEVSQNDNEKT